MSQHPKKQAEPNLESVQSQHRRLRISEHCKLLLSKLAYIVQSLFPFRPEDVCIQIGKTRIKVRVIKSPYSESQRRMLAFDVAQYLVRVLTSGTLLQQEGELIQPTFVTAPPEAAVGSEIVSVQSRIEEDPLSRGAAHEM